METILDSLGARPQLPQARTSEWLGYMSDQSLQTLSQNRVASSSTSTISTPREQLDKSSAEYLRHHGAGYTL
jgi:hypothetical protein